MVKITNLSYRYSKNSNNILKNVNLIIKPNKVSIILGNNGVGKTTLFKCISGIYKNFDGRILVNGIDISTNTNKKISQNISYVFQNNDNTNLTVYESILLGRTPYINLYPTKNDYDIVDSLIKKFNLEKFVNYPFSSLSGGYKQIVNIARAMSSDNKIFLFDEITSNLDISNKLIIFDIIKNLINDGKTIVIALHDLNDALQLGDDFYFLKDGSIYCKGDESIINKSNIKKVYNIEVEISQHGGKKYVVYKN